MSKFRDRLRGSGSGKGLGGDVAGRLESNINARIASGRSLVNSEMSVVKGFFNAELNVVKSGVNKVLGLEPIPAVVDTVVNTIENIVDVPVKGISNLGKFIKEQGAITREWVPKR